MVVKFGVVVIRVKKHCQTEISNADVEMGSVRFRQGWFIKGIIVDLVYQNVLQFNVSMNNSFLVEEIQSQKHLLHDASDLFLTELDPFELYHIFEYGVH